MYHYEFPCPLFAEPTSQFHCILWVYWEVGALFFSIDLLESFVVEPCACVND
jgi:hypothetical protein